MSLTGGGGGASLLGSTFLYAEHKRQQKEAGEKEKGVSVVSDMFARAINVFVTFFCDTDTEIEKGQRHNTAGYQTHFRRRRLGAAVNVLPATDSTVI